MSVGEAIFGNPGDPAQPSPSIWTGCQRTLLRDLGLGYFAQEDFLAQVVTATGSVLTPIGSGAVLQMVNNAVTTTAITMEGTRGGIVTLTTPATDNTYFSLYSEPFAKIVRNSGNRVWAEASVAAKTLVDASFCVGLTTRTNAVATAPGVLLDNPATQAAQGTTAATAYLTAASFIGFVSRQISSVLAKVDAAHLKSTTNYTADSSDITNSARITAGGGTAGNLVAATQLKLGIYFDGKTKLAYFVNGYKVKTVDVDSTFDQTSDYAFNISYKTGAAAANGLSVDWARYAYQERT